MQKGKRVEKTPLSISFSNRFTPVRKILTHSLLSFSVSVLTCFMVVSPVATTEAAIINSVIEIEADNEFLTKDEIRQKEKEEQEKAEAEKKKKEEEEKAAKLAASHTTYATLTAYCVCDKCCNTGATVKHTATGAIPEQGRTVAVDPSVIPLGSTVVIDGHEYIAEDTGGDIGGNRIDVFFSSHQDALQFGVRQMEVHWY